MTKNQFRSVTINNVTFDQDKLPVIIAGPCVIESARHVEKMAWQLKELVTGAGFEFIFKASYDKANRSSIHAFRGPGMQEGLDILRAVRENVKVSVITDVHSVDQIGPVAEIVDAIQFPAFLCRQTDLFIEAGKHDIAVNIKKGQFLSPGNMHALATKARESGVKDFMITERGTTFGYERLVVDYTGLVIMKELNVPLIFDGTHSVQQPGAGGDHTGGNRNHVPYLCRAAAAVGVQGFFLEVHDCPEKAKCDGPNMVSPETLQKLLLEIRSIHDALKGSTCEQ